MIRRASRVWSRDRPRTLALLKHRAVAATGIVLHLGGLLSCSTHE